MKEEYTILASGVQQNKQMEDNRCPLLGTTSKGKKVTILSSQAVILKV